MYTNNTPNEHQTTPPTETLAALTDAMTAQIQTKAMYANASSKAKILNEKAADYEQKAMQLTQKGHTGQMDAPEADRLAAEALKLMANALNEAQKYEVEAKQRSADVERLGASISQLQAKLAITDDELKQIISELDIEAIEEPMYDAERRLFTSEETLDMLQRMKEKVGGEIAQPQKRHSTDDYDMLDMQIDAAIDTKNKQAAEALNDLKERMKQKNKDI